MDWTIDGTSITPLTGSDTDWRREPRVTTLTLAGTGRNEFHVTGYGPYTRTLRARIDGDTEYNTLRALLGKQVTLSDGITNWSTTLTSFQAMQHLNSSIYFGTLTFLRSE